MVEGVSEPRRFRPSSRRPAGAPPRSGGKARPRPPVRRGCPAGRRYDAHADRAADVSLLASEIRRKGRPPRSRRASFSAYLRCQEGNVSRTIRMRIIPSSSRAPTTNWWPWTGFTAASWWSASRPPAGRSEAARFGDSFYHFCHVFRCVNGMAVMLRRGWRRSSGASAQGFPTASVSLPRRQASRPKQQEPAP